MLSSARVRVRRGTQVYRRVPNGIGQLLSVYVYGPTPPVEGANPQKTVLFLLRICYGTHNMLGIYYRTDDCIELLA